MLMSRIWLGAVPDISIYKTVKLCAETRTLLMVTVAVGKSGKVWFGSGGGGILLSRALMSRLVPYLDTFLAEKWPARQPQADVAIAYAAMLVSMNRACVCVCVRM
jgi:hypothetical protein